MAVIKQNLKLINEKIEQACLKRPQDLHVIKPTLVAVSKIKPTELIIAAYEAGQRHFGENYVQELVDKASSPEILEKCKEIKWHFIGHLQSNKINKVLPVPNLHMIETVDSEKLADSLNKHWPKFAPDRKLKVMIQVNTSQEKDKSGINPDEAVNLYKHIVGDCQNLEVEGLMTIGKYGYDPEIGLNPDFLSLVKCRDGVAKSLGVPWSEIRLSMGMSTDFEQAVELGSSYVRVGTAIFGERDTKQ